MYAFLSKVFGRKKDDRDAPQPVLGPRELLGGRFEAISPNVSPTAQFLEFDPKKINGTKDKEVEKDAGFSFFKGKWRPASPDVKPTRKLDILPHLSLNFQEPKGVSVTPDLGLLFTTDQILSDAVIGQRRLNPFEALVLVQACSQAIIAKGVETLGVMHPHWYAASHSIQRRVISHFIYLSNLEGLTSIASPNSPTSPKSAFETEVNDTLTPHDIAAILRWGLRHVEIEGGSLGTDDGWYKTFFEAEGTPGYPLKAFSEKLAPLLPTAHLQLLTATLEIFSSLAAHAEANGTSGSKLCKIFGLWLLTAHRVENKDDWQSFYARWERTGRMLEHLFLSRIRDESTDRRMPTRLLELVHKYPYTKGLSSPATDLPLLPRPPFTTRLYDAFFVRIETELPYGTRKPHSKLHPLLLLADAFSTKVEEGEFADIWAKIITASKDGDSASPSNVFTDDTIRILSLVPGKPIGQEVRSPTFSLISPMSPHKRSLSADSDRVAGHSKAATPMTPLSSVRNGIGSDWAQFSASGFLEVSPNIIPLASTLLDTDIEKTIPPEPASPLSRKSSKRSKAASPSSPRKSIDLARSGTESSPEDIEDHKTIIKASQLQVIQLDEAFIDFWSDSLLDPICSDWPSFIICKFKPSLLPELKFGESQTQKTLQWLVLEHVYTIRAPPIPVEIVRPRPSSPSSQSLSVKKRFSFWNVSRTASGSSATSLKGKKKEHELKVGEMGELLEEEPKNETKEPTVKLKSPIFRPRKSLDVAQKPMEITRKPVPMLAEEAKIDEEGVSTAVAAVATGVVAAGTAAVVVNGLSKDEPSLAQAAEVDHLTNTLAIDEVLTPIAVTETVVPSFEPTIKNDDIPLSTTCPAVVSSLEANIVGTESLKNLAVESATITAEVEAAGTYPESELQSKLTEVELAPEGAIVVHDTTDGKDRSTPLPSVLEPEVVVEDIVEAEGHIEIDPTSSTHVAVELEVSDVTDAAPFTVEAPGTTEGNEVEETASVLVAHEPIVEVAIPEPKVETEAPIKSDSTLTTDESPALFTSETSREIEAVPAVVDDSPIAKSPENSPAQPEIQLKLEPTAVEVEHIPAPAEEVTDIDTGKTNDSAPIHVVAEHPRDVDGQEVYQAQSDATPIVEEALGDVEDQAEATIASTKLEVFSMTEDVEKDSVTKEPKHDLAFEPDVANLEPEVEIKASTESVPASVEQDYLANIEHEPVAIPSAEPAAAAEGPPELVLDGNAAISPEEVAVGVEPQSELEQETLNTAQEIEAGPDSKDISTAVVHEVEAEVANETHAIAAPVTANNFVAPETTETEQPVMPDAEVDSIKREDENFIETVPLATTDNVSSMDGVEPKVTHGAVPETQNDSVESGTTLNIEPIVEHEVDATTVPTAEETIPDVYAGLEPEFGLVETGAETKTEVDAEVQPQPDPPSLAEKDIKTETRVDEPISESGIIHIEAKADAEGPPEHAPTSSTEESQTTGKLEPEVDSNVPVEEEPLVPSQVEAENIALRIESETTPTIADEAARVVNVDSQIVVPVDVSSEHVSEVLLLPDEVQTEITPAPVDVVHETFDTVVDEPIVADAEDTQFVASPGRSTKTEAGIAESNNAHYQVIHDAATVTVIETCTNELVVLPSVEESLETTVEPSYESADDGTHVIPEVDSIVLETHLPGEGELVSTEASTDISEPSQELPVATEPKQPVTYKEASHENSPIAVETGLEPLSTIAAPEEKDEITAEPAPEIEAAAEGPGSPELREHSVEETVDAVVEALSETEAEVTIPIEGRSVLTTGVPLSDAQLEESIATTIPDASSSNEVSALEVELEQPQVPVEGHAAVVASSELLYESYPTPKHGTTPIVGDDISVEPIEAQVEAPSIPVAEKSERTDEDKPQIIPTNVEAPPAQIEEERSVLAAVQDDTTLSGTEPLESEFVSVEEPVAIVESESDALHMATSVPLLSTSVSDMDNAVIMQSSEELGDKSETVDTLPELEPYVPSHDAEIEGSDASASLEDSVDTAANSREETTPSANLGAELHGTPTTVQLETATSTAPDTPRVSAIPDSTDTLYPAAETVQLPPIVSYEPSAITHEATVVLVEGTFDVEVQSEVQVPDETYNVVKIDAGVADVDILPEVLPEEVLPEEVPLEEVSPEEVLVPDVPLEEVLPSTAVDDDGAIAPSTSLTTATSMMDDVMSDSQVVAMTDPTETILKPSAEEDDPIDEILISNEPAAPVPPHEDHHLQQPEASVDSQESNVTQNANMNPTVESVVIPSHEPAAEINDTVESIVMEGTLTNLDAPANAVNPPSVGETIIANIQHPVLTSGDTSKPEATNEPSSQDIASITTAELDTSPTHIDGISDIAPSAVNPTPELPTSPGEASEIIEYGYPSDSPPDAHTDAEPLMNPASEEVATAASVNPPTQDKSAGEEKVDSAEEVDTLVTTEASNNDQDDSLSLQVEDLSYQASIEIDPATEQVKSDAEIESTDPVAQEPAAIEEAKPEEPSATVEIFSDHSEINNSNTQPSAGVEPTEASLVHVNEITIPSVEQHPTELIQEPSLLEDAAEPQEVDDVVPATIPDELSTADPVIDESIEGPQTELEAEDNASDKPPQTDITATDETAPTRESEDAEDDTPAIKEPLESIHAVLEAAQPEILGHTESSLLASSTSTETEVGQTDVSTEPSEEPENSVETPENKLTDIQVLPKAKDNLVQDLEELVGEVDISSTAVAEASSVVFEPATVVPEDPHIEDGIPQAAISLPIEEAVTPVDAVETISTAESSMGEIAPIESGPSIPVPELPEGLSIDNSVQAKDGLVDPRSPTIETTLIGEHTEEVKAAILQTVVNEDNIVSEAELDEAEVEAPETHVSKGNGHPPITQETVGTLDDVIPLGQVAIGQGFEVTPENLASEDDINTEPKSIESIHHPDISLEPLSTTD